MVHIEKTLKKHGITYKNGGIIYGYKYVRGHGHPQYDFLMVQPLASHTLVVELAGRPCASSSEEDCAARANIMAGIVVCADIFELHKQKEFNVII